MSLNQTYEGLDILDLVTENAKKRESMIKNGKLVTASHMNEQEPINAPSLETQTSMDSEFISHSSSLEDQPRVDPLDPIAYRPSQPSFSSQSPSSPQTATNKPKPFYDKSLSHENLEAEIVSSLKNVNYENWLSIELNNLFNQMFAEKDWQNLMNKALFDIQERLLIYIKNELLSKEKNFSESVVHTVIENYKQGLMDQMKKVSHEALKRSHLGGASSFEEPSKKDQEMTPAPSMPKDPIDQAINNSIDSKTSDTTPSLKEPLMNPPIKSLSSIESPFTSPLKNLNNSLHQTSQDLLADSQEENELSHLDKMLNNNNPHPLKTEKFKSHLSSSPIMNNNGVKEIQKAIMLETNSYLPQFYKMLFLASCISMLGFGYVLYLLSPILFFALPSNKIWVILLANILIGFLREKEWFYKKGLDFSIKNQRFQFRWFSYFLNALIFNIIFSYLFLTDFSATQFHSEYSNAISLEFLGKINLYIQHILSHYIKLSDWLNLQRILLYFFTGFITILYIIRFFKNKTS